MAGTACCGSATWRLTLRPVSIGSRPFVPLDAYAGQRVNLVLETDPGPAGNADADRAGWGMPWLMSGTLGVAVGDR